MDAKQLAEKFVSKVESAVSEKAKQNILSAESEDTLLRDADYCKIALEHHVMPFLQEFKAHMPENQFSLAPQIDAHDHKIVGVSFKIGDGAATTISTAFGNVTVTRFGDSGSSKGISAVFAADAEPYISNSGDLTREKTAKLIEMIIDNVP